MSETLTAGTMISAEREGAILVVKLNRPDRLNALSRTLQDEMAVLWRRVKTDPSVRVVVLTGAGRAFSAGADTSDLTSATRPDATKGTHALDFSPARVLDVPVIVAVNGLCIGGALNFVADADIVLAAESAWFTDPHVTQGQVSGPEAIKLAAKASPYVVTQLALCGGALRLTAREASAAGLIGEVVADELLLDRAREIAAMIAAQSPTAVRKTLAGLRRVVREAIDAHVERGWNEVVAQWSHPDALEGPRAFVDKREPRWAAPEPTRVEEA
jgi:enoyl-CoA hydratase/carnithine racemase